MDLYGRLEELQGMTHLLIDDVALLKPMVGELDPDPSDAMKAHRRFYIRAIFALVEAFVEQHRRLLLDLCEAGTITLAPKQLMTLREIREIRLPDGTVQQREQYLQLFEKIKTVYTSAGDGFGQQLKVTFGDDGWVTFSGRDGASPPSHASQAGRGLLDLRAAPADRERRERVVQDPPKRVRPRRAGASRTASVVTDLPRETAETADAGSSALNPARPKDLRTWRPLGPGESSLR